MMAIVLLSMLGLTGFASARWSVDSRDGFDWRVDDGSGHRNVSV